MIKGITVELKTRTKTGVDAYRRNVYEEKWITVDNVLVGEPSAEDAANELNLTGKRLAYTLGIPKGDEHDWADTEVRFYGKTWRTIGDATEGIDAMIPLNWNKKVKVEAYEQ